MSVIFFTPLMKRLVVKVKMVGCIFYMQSLIHIGAKNVQTFYKHLPLSLLHDKSVNDER